ncbi:MAG: hypothetical protein QXZ43_00965 [Candidatus Aenigmatarchaeota archaeon]
MQIASYCSICKKYKTNLVSCEFCGTIGCTDCVDIKLGICKKCKKGLI